MPRPRRTWSLPPSLADYRLLAESSADIVMFCDTEGVIAWISPSVEAELGRRPDDVVGRSWHLLIDPEEDTAAASDGQHEATDTGRLHRVVTAVATDGTRRRYESSARIVRDRRGRITGRIAGWNVVPGSPERSAPAFPGLLFGALPQRHEAPEEEP